MRGVVVRVVLSLVVAATAVFVMPAFAADGHAAGADPCGPITIDVLFPDDDPPDAPTFGSRSPDAPTPVPDDVVVPATCAPFVYDMLYPLAVDSPEISPFGADRDGGSRRHKGVDIAAPKMTPVLAVAGGTVSWIRDELAGDCCAVGIQHDDGWYSYYIHLNNDTLGTDDGLGFGLAPGMVDGATVEAGQVIGWVGDSGNAEETVPHLHFELRTPARISVDASASLRNARRTTLVTAATEEAASASGLLGAPALRFGGAYADDDRAIQVASIDLLASVGLLDGCDEAGLVFCPNAAATGETITTWLQRAVPDTGGAIAVEFGEPGRNVERQLLDELAATTSIDELRGCGERRLCADLPLTRAEFAAMAADVLPPTNHVADAFSDDDGHRFEAAIDQLAAAGVADTCSLPGSPTFAPDRLLTRAEAAQFISRILGFETAPDCSNLE